MRQLSMSVLCLLALALFCSSAVDAGEAAAKGKKKPARKGPLAKLPSKPGAHIAKIKAMADNSWLNLGRPKSDPKWGDGIGRAWSSKMVYAPDLRGAFINGEGRHGATSKRNGKTHYNDDLFFYDIHQHRWICVYPGMAIGKYDLTVNQDGFEVDKDGHPRPVAYQVHSYGFHTYDTGRKLYMALWSPSGYWRKHMPKRLALIEKHYKKLNGLSGWANNKHRCSTLNQASPWMYDTAAGHWRRSKTRTKTPRIGHGAHLIYLPPQKKLFFLGAGGTHFYDPAKNDWEALKPTGPRPPKPIDAASCYDPKRQRIYIAMGSYGGRKKIEGVENQVWAYDVLKNTWIDLKAKGKLPPRPRAVSGSGITRMHYDSASDVVVFFSFGTDISGSPKTRGIYAYSAEDNKWTLATGEFAPAWPRGCNHTFYDPELNAHFIYKAGDSVGKGTMFAYRYKRAGKPRPTAKG
jgi:hypothetical protein